jgi:hypothetical protein
VHLLFSLIDNVRVTTIPEPGAWMFLGVAAAGAVGAAIIRRCKNPA